MEKIYKNIDGNRIELNVEEYKIFTSKKENISLQNQEYNNLLKTKIFNEITKIYPISKQIDIIAKIGEYNENDFAEMKNFIENKMLEYKNLKK